MDYLWIPAVSLVSFILSIATSKWIYRRQTRPLFMGSERWLDIDEYPIDESYRDIIVTDGTEVSNTYIPDYNSRGQPIFSYRKLIVTHWMPQPAPPKKID